MIGFIGMMVKYKWFETIFLAFLPVGHTHDDVDGTLFGSLGATKKVIPCQSPVIYLFNFSIIYL